MNYQSCPAIAEDGMIVAPERYVRRRDRDMGRSVGAHDQDKIRNIAGRCSTMIMPSRGAGEMRAGRLEVWSFAFRELMNVDGMLSGRQALDVQFDSDARRRIRQSCCPDALPRAVFDLHNHRFGPRLCR